MVLDEGSACLRQFLWCGNATAVHSAGKADPEANFPTPSAQPGCSERLHKSKSR